jgi:small conductance mechanosensitive channel
MQEATTPAATTAAPSVQAATEVVAKVASDPVGTLERLTHQATDWLFTTGPSILLALILLTIAWIVAASVRGLIIRVTQQAKMDITLGKFLGNLAKWAIIIFALITVAGTLGISTTGFAAAVGAAGLAIGLALQGNLGNLAAGVLILIFRPFKIGDAVVVAGQSGVVDGIDLFTTNLDTGDNRRVIIPNNAIFSGVIENQSHHPRRVTSIRVPIAPTVEIDRAERILRAAVERVLSQPGAVRDPGPAVTLADLNPVPLWDVAIWAETSKILAVREQLLREVKGAIDAEKIGPAPAVQEIRIVGMPEK